MDIQDQFRALERRVSYLEQMDTEPVACAVYNSTDFSHDSTGNWLAITFDSERRDTLGMHSVASNTSRITFTLGGWYLVSGHAQFAAKDTGERALAIYLNGATYIAVTNRSSPSATEAESMCISCLYYFAATNYIELVAYQNSGDVVAIKAQSNYSPELRAIRLP